ncbi:MAG: glycosyltransferase family 4 protein [Bacteroidia bacterium]|jgi:glycosyltransferase involved in cell wall biosynthesis|nr:glycosyltransferase family 4 protein [Bacteroidia bacterium]
MPLKVCYIISLVHKANIFEWVAEELSPEKFSQVYILLHHEETEFEKNLRQKGLRVYRINYRSKKNILSAIFGMVRILRREKPAIVHTHLFEAGVAGQIAARMAFVPRRIHTRHDATVHHDYYPNGVKYDKLTNRLATDVIAITDSVKKILMELEQVPERKITVLHHGFRLNEFEEVNDAAVNELKQHYFPQGKPAQVVGVISRYMHWKGIQYTIDAFAQLRKDFPQAHLVLANADGPYWKELRQMLRQLPENSYTEIKFESRIFALYRLFDVFVHVPIDGRSEAFGQIYVEAMASGVPCVVTLSGIAHDYIRHGVNASVVPYKNSIAIAEAVKTLLLDKTHCAALTAQARRDVDPAFTIRTHVNALEKLYLRGTNLQ